MDTAIPREERLRALLMAGTEIASELSLEVLLQRLVATAAELTGARYAALGPPEQVAETLRAFQPPGCATWRSTLSAHTRTGRSRSSCSPAG